MLLNAGALVDYIGCRYPELRGESFRIVTEGMQNTVVIVGERLVFRFPLLPDNGSWETERRLLPKLANRVTLPIPSIAFESDAKDRPPYIGYPIIPGEQLDDKHFFSLSDSAKEQVALEIAQFLTSLHAFRNESASENDPDECRRTWRECWTTFFDELRSCVEPRLGREERRWVQRLEHDYLASELNSRFTPCWIHGDFKREHILYDPRAERLTGIIDFGQLKIGDPAYDFHYLLLNYGERFVQRVYSRYRGPKDSRFWSRIETYTHFLWLSELLYAVRALDESVWRRGTKWLSSVAGRSHDGIAEEEHNGTRF